MNRFNQRRVWVRSTSTTMVIAILLCLAALNIIRRASWSEVEDGVLWRAINGDVVATDVAAGTAAARAGVQPGDVLLAIDGAPIDRVEDAVAVLHASAAGRTLTYTILRLGAKQQMNIQVAPVPSSPRGLYFALAAVGVFSLLVGASVRLRRPDHQATLHFFWLTVAFFGVMAFSFTGQLDPLDWTFYWGDLTAQLLLPPLLLHFALVFPDRADAWVRSETGRKLVPAIYVPALILGALSVASVVNGGAHGDVLTRVSTIVQRGQLIYLAVSLLAGLAIMIRALRHVRSVTARRQLRWIIWGSALGAVPFAFGYALPFAFGMEPLRGFEFTALLLGLIPLAFASAIVRYRLMDVEVIIKRALVYAAALAAIAAIYAVLLRIAGAIFLRDADQRNPVIALLATFVVVLLSRPVKDAIQAGLDRVYYRDRYDYRRALVGFARDLNSDLDLLRLSERLLHRVTETLLVDRMALMLAPASVSEDAADFVTIVHAGFADAPPALTRGSEVATRLISGHTVAFDETLALRRLDAREVETWREAGIHYFVPCVSKEGTIAVMALGRKASAEPLSSEDMALLAAVAAQAATALENGRLYRQLRTKADELERMRQFSENILESLNDGLAVVDRNGRVIRWNRQLEELYGVRHEDAVGCAAEALFEPHIAGMIRSAAVGAPEGAAYYKIPLSTRHEPARRLLVNVGATPLRDSHAHIAGTILIVEDISSRVQLEEQLQISEKMASIGLLAAGVAHEVNTPLTGISSFTQMLLEGAQPDDPSTQVLEKIERQTFRAAKIVNGLLNLARPAQVDSGPCDINAVINDVLSLLDHQLRTGSIQVRKELADSAPIVQGIEHKLQQVFLNLFLNARDAMPKGGWLTIATREDPGGAAIEVADTGSGIPADLLSRIYDPFFTTKEIGKGTGLGLSITYGIIQEHGGTIACESHVGQGTRFSIRLPLAEAARARRSGS
ncbi:MAG TPA: ATP-binding protein [Vicinamibacterales bacterium]|jgi:PAS domain S-box-containing protein|nr:ATP-binding protein [Vicinamibacterales bacterium]